MTRFGSDKPDLRWTLELRDWTQPLATVDFRILKQAVEAKGQIRGLLLEKGASLSRKQIEGIEGAAKAAGAQGLLWVRRSSEGVTGTLSKYLSEGHLSEMGIAEGSLAFVAAGAFRATSAALTAARLAAIQAMSLPKVREHAWLWVTDFPLFEEEGGRLGPGHHPFVLPHPEDRARFRAEPLAARGQAYDLVYNGTELGSGSLRIHEPELQREIFRVLGLSEDEIQRKFGFLLEALENGAPPHGGIAFGVDRLVQRFAGLANIRDVIAFPKTTAARALFEGAPTPIAAHDLAELGLRLAEV
jgi:aspartyl-tRNA synthetase